MQVFATTPPPLYVVAQPVESSARPAAAALRPFLGLLGWLGEIGYDSFIVFSFLLSFWFYFSILANIYTFVNVVLQNVC